MKGRLRIAGAQIPVTRDVASNVAGINRAMEFAAAESADVLLTPEGSLSGYTHEFDRDAVAAALEDVTDEARDAGLGLALGACFVEDDGRCYNQIRFYAPDGTYLGSHTKTLRCGTLDDPPKGEINHYEMTPLRTFQLNGITVGGLICNDLWAYPMCTAMDDPHLTQQLARQGARIVLHAVNGGRSAQQFTKVSWRYHEANLRVRAKAGRLWIVTVDNCYPMTLPCSAPCGVIDPNGNWVLRTAPVGEQLFAHTIEIDDVEHRR